MLTVACVLRAGGIYDATWVARLKAGVTRHLPIQHRFLCLSDVNVPCERIALEHDWPGWWAKIELFRLPGPVLYFDLDTAIVGDLSEIAREAERHPMTVLRDFYREHGIGSGVMAWAGAAQPLYETFRVAADLWMRELGRRGDQGFLEVTAGPDRMQRWQDILPGQIVSYKGHGVAQRGIPAGARVVCLHGWPKFADMPVTDMVRIAWERAA